MARKRSWRQRLSGWIGGTDAPDIVEAPGSGGGGVKRDPNETIVKKIGLALDVGTSREYAAPTFDLTQITSAYDTEAYVRQAVDKYIEMMFKAGWDIVGKNQNAVDYIRMRLKLIAEMTQTPSDQLWIEIAEDLVKYGNVIIVKARDKGNLLGGTQTGINVQGLGGDAPVAGYFPINVTTIQILRDKNGTVKGWQQEVEGQDKPVKFKVSDVVHIYYKKEKGAAFATPFLLAALDDIRALRQAEETVLRLIYRNLHPLLHIKVGTDEMPGETNDVNLVKDEFESMDLEAGFVTSERVNITAVSSDKIIDAKEYLKYFEQRVFTGLGVSELMMGRGNTANRSTGDNLSGEFADRVKAFQKVMAIFVDEFMIKELLMEGGFDPVLNPDDDVDFVFKEIDVDAKIKAENHAIYQYEHNAITEEEMRTLIGRDPITDRATMFMSLVTIPVIDATAAASAQYAPDPASGGSTAAKKTSGTPAANNKNKPTNQSGTKSAPKKVAAEVDSAFKMRYQESLNRTFEQSHEAVLKLISEFLNDNDEQRLAELSQVVRFTEEDLVHVMQHHLGMDYAAPYSPHIYSLCERLHGMLLDTVTEMRGSEKEQRIYETVGGLYSVLSMRLADVANQAYDTYLPSAETDEEVEE